MEIEFVLACDNALADTERKVSIIGIFTEISASSFPALHPQMFVVVGIRGSAGKYPVEVTIGRDGAKHVAKATAEIGIDHDGKTGTFIAKFVGLAFPEPGEYNIVVTVDDKDKLLPLHLVAPEK